MYTIYVIFSCRQKKYYTGHAKDVADRLKCHNSGYVRSTKSGVPWIKVYTEVCSTKQEAYRRERQIKSYKGGRAFKRLINK